MRFGLHFSILLALAFPGLSFSQLARAQEPTTVQGESRSRAAESKPESKHDKDLRECNAEADAAVAEAKLTSPKDVVEVRRVAFNRCMSARSYAVGKARAK